jgi:hypothetical protein
MSKPLKLVIAAGIVLLLGVIVYSTLSLARYECEVCVTFKGRSACRVAAGATREETIRTATDNACAFLASGRTDSMACGRTPPTSIRWIKE